MVQLRQGEELLDEEVCEEEWDRCLKALVHLVQELDQVGQVVVLRSIG